MEVFPWAIGLLNYTVLPVRCHREAHSAEAIPRLISRGPLVRREIASALRASQ
jgi:hypothetical protein